MPSDATLSPGLWKNAPGGSPDVRVSDLARIVEQLAIRLDRQQHTMHHVAARQRQVHRHWIAAVSILLPAAFSGGAALSYSLAQFRTASDAKLTIASPLVPPSSERIAMADLEEGSIFDSQAASAADGSSPQNALEGAVERSVAAAAIVEPQPAPAVSERSQTVMAGNTQASGRDLAADVTPATPPAPVPDTSGNIVLRAVADCWIQVRRPDMRVIFSRTLHKDETWTVPDEPGLVMATGNAGGLEILVDGVVTPGLGGPGLVRSSVPLRADLLRGGKFGPSVDVALAGTAAVPSRH